MPQPVQERLRLGLLRIEPLPLDLHVITLFCLLGLALSAAILPHAVLPDPEWAALLAP